MPGKEGGGERKKMAPIGGPGASVSEREKWRGTGWLGRLWAVWAEEKRREGERWAGLEREERESLFILFFVFKLKHHLNKFI